MSAEELESQIETAEEAGDVPKLLEVIGACSNHGGDDEWTEVAEASLDALYRLAKGGNNAVSEAAGSSMSIVFAALAAWQEEEAIVEVALGCIVTLSSKVSSADDTLDLSLLMTIFKAFPDESTIQEQACLAVEGLALASETHKTTLKGTDGLARELATSKERITNERNKAYPGRAADAVGLSL